MDTNDKVGAILAIIVIIFCSFIVGRCTGYCEAPDLIEVYRGNTELKIKYTIVDNDTVNCDSVVVLKSR